MKSWPFAVVGLACLVAAGCRTDPNILLLERELRIQEDEIYRLRGVVEDYQEALRSRRENVAEPQSTTPVDPGRSKLLDMIQPQGIPGAAGETVPPRDDANHGGRDTLAPPSPYGDPSQKPPGGEQPDGEGADGPGQGPADIDLPIPKPSAQGSVGDGTEVRQTSGTGPILPVDSRQVAQIALNHSLSGGYDADGRPGDDGIVVVIQPRDARGRWLEAPAEMSVALLDPALEGEAARLARWDFTAAETLARFRKTNPGRAIHLEMPWPADPPMHSRLYVFVRYTTRDGRRLQVEGPIRIAPPGQTSERWVRAKPASAAPVAIRPANHSEPSSDPTLGAADDQAESPEGRSTPAVSPPAIRPRSPTAAQDPPKLVRPVWSPSRP